MLSTTTKRLLLTLALLVGAASGVSAQDVTRGRFGGVVTTPLLAPATPVDCTAPGFSFQGDPNTGIGVAAADKLSGCAGGVEIWRADSANTVFGLGPNALAFGANQNALDVVAWREAAGHWFQRNGANAQRESWANTWTSTVNYESFSVDAQTLAGSWLTGSRTAATGTTKPTFFEAQANNGANQYIGLRLNQAIANPIRLGFFTDAGALVNQTAFTTLVSLGEATNTATSGTFNTVAVLPTYNQASGTAANTDLLINRTQTAVGSGAQLLMDLQVSTVSKFKVDNTGAVTATGSIAAQGLSGIFSGAASITSGVGTGVTVNATGILQRQIYKVTVDRTAFICAAVTCDLTIGTLPAKTNLVGLFADLTQVFACSAVCTSSTLSMTSGPTVGTFTFLTSFDADAAITLIGDADAELGTLINRGNAVQAAYTSSFSSTTTITIRLISGTGNIGTGAATNLSTGSITFYVVTERLP